MDPSKKNSVLIVEDEENLRYILNLCLTEAEFDTIAVSSAEEALKKLSLKHFDFIITDLRLPQTDGFSFITQLRTFQTTSYVILMTAYGDKEKAVEALKAGADDYISKPFRPDELIIKINIVLAKKDLLVSETISSDTFHSTKQKSIFPTDNIIIAGQSVKAQELRKTIENVAAYKSTVLIIGEAGTETESAARYIHAHSTRSEKIFLAISCGSLSENLIESELFGHEKGSFTGAIAEHTGIFAHAKGGTVFLSEIEKLPHSIQVKLLRVLQEETIRPVGSNDEKTIDVRFIASCQSDPELLVQSGVLRSDLYYRLRVITIIIPELRNRIEDVPLLARYFINTLSKKYHRNQLSIEEEALSLLQSYTWPGNIEELKSVIERAVVLCKKENLSVDDFQFLSHENNESFSNPNLKEAISKTEREMIENALEQTNGNKVKAAKLLGISHRALMYKINKLNSSGS